MQFDSSNDTVAILYDIENAPYEMLAYTLTKARRFQPCRIIVVTDWEKCPTDQKRWERLRRRPGFTFRSVTRTFLGKNSLDSALYDSAKLLYQDGVRRYFIITTDSDFVRIAEALNENDKSYIIGVGTKQASETLRNAYDEFLCYPPEVPEKKGRKEKVNLKEKKSAGKNNQEEDKTKSKKGKAAGNKKTAALSEASLVRKETAGKSLKETADSKGKKASKPAKKAKVVKEKKTKERRNDLSLMSAEEKKTAELAKGKERKDIKGKLQSEEMKRENSRKDELHAEGILIHLPRTLTMELEHRQQEEGVSMDELITFLLMRGLMH